MCFEQMYEATNGCDLLMTSKSLFNKVHTKGFWKHSSGIGWHSLVNRLELIASGN